MKYSGEELLAIWRRSGTSQRALAKQLGLNFNKMHGLIFRAQQQEKEAILKDKEKIDVKTKGNYTEVRTVTAKIKSEEDLIEACGIDTDVWELEEFKIKTWEGYRKDVDQDMEWVDSRMTGYKVDHGGINTEVMFSVYASFVRKQPVAIKPVINPMSFTIKPVKPPRKEKGVFKKALYFSDTHFGFERDLFTGELTPYHDRGALSIILSVIADNYFDRIIHGGDGIDSAEWSTKYVRSPEMRFTTQPMLYETGWFLGQISILAPEAEKDYLEGNHELRIPEYYFIHAQHMLRLRQATQFEGHEVTSVPYLLDLDNLGWKWHGGYPNNKIWLRPDLMLEHGNTVSAKPGATAGNVVEKSNVSRVFGHIHRREQATRLKIDGDGTHSITATTGGCLCHIDGRVPGSNEETNWQNGFVVIEYNDEEFMPPQIVPIENGKALYNDKVYHAWDYYDQLKMDTKNNL